MKKTANEYISWLRRRWMSKRRRVQAPADAHATFNLVYAGKVIGKLAAEGGRWSFSYTDEFRRSRLRPMVEFPDVEKTYRTGELWPYFFMRVPSLKQPAIREILEREHIDENDEIKLLRRFGRRTVTDPFELVEVEN